MIKRFLLFIILITSFTAAHSQDLPIGGWRDCLPYRFATGVVQGNGKIYCITSLDIFSVSTDNSIQQYSKVTGLSDINITTAAYNSQLHVLVIGYYDSNIDLLYDNGRVVNVPAIEQATIIGSRSINGIYFIGSEAYISCGFGIVNLNLTTQLINDTYIIGAGGTQIAVNSMTSLNDTIYAATTGNSTSPGGVYYNALSDSNDFANFASWKLSTAVPGSDSFVTAFNNAIYTVQKNKLYKLKNNNNASVVYSEPGWHINGITASSTDLVLAEDLDNVISAKIELINTSGTQTAVTPSGLGLPLAALQDNNSNLWIADIYNGLYFYNSQNSTTQKFTPNSPFTAGDEGLAAYNGAVYVAPDPEAAAGNTDGFFVRTNNTWTNYNQGNIALPTDVNNVIISPIDYSAYFGTFSKGIFQFQNGKIINTYGNTNSTLRALLGDSSSPNNYALIAAGMAFDNENNLWVTNYGAAKPISMFNTSNKTWLSFLAPSSVAPYYFSEIVVDQFDQKWIINTGGRILVMSSGSSNNTFRILGTGVGNGNLPSSTVTSLAVDQQGNVWVGTSEGITVFYCPGDELTSQGCDAQQIIYSTSAGNGYLLGTDVINAIVIDGANRKWVGTNTGLYLLSADGTQEVENFTTSNSPLFSNNVISLALDPISGDLFIGTDAGLLEYRTNANEGSTTNCNVSVFPDPVRQNYTGPITISGLVANATVKITDVTGGLIYQTTALGGQATWNGNNLKGTRAQTGVYLVFVSNSDGSVTCTGKFLLIN